MLRVGETPYVNRDGITQIARRSRTWVNHQAGAADAPQPVRFPGEWYPLEEIRRWLRQLRGPSGPVQDPDPAQVRDIDGTAYVSRDGLAQMAGWSRRRAGQLLTAARLLFPGGDTGVAPPQPVRFPGEWYPLEEIRRWLRQSRVTPKQVNETVIRGVRCVNRRWIQGHTGWPKGLIDRRLDPSRPGALQPFAVGERGQQHWYREDEVRQWLAKFEITPVGPGEADIEGVRCVTQAWIRAETGLSKPQINREFSPSRRAETGAPAPFRTEGGQHWYPKEEVREWMQRRQQRRDRWRPPRLPQPENPDQVISLAEYAQLINVDRNTMYSYVRKSRDRWARGEVALLATPCREERVSTGIRYWWRLGDVVDHQNRRPGRRRPGRSRSSRSA